MRRSSFATNFSLPGGQAGGDVVRRTRRTLEANGRLRRLRRSRQRSASQNFTPQTLCMRRTALRGASFGGYFGSGLTETISTWLPR